MSGMNSLGNESLLPGVLRAVPPGRDDSLFKVALHTDFREVMFPEQHDVVLSQKRDICDCVVCNQDPCQNNRYIQLLHVSLPITPWGIPWGYRRDSLFLLSLFTLYYYTQTHSPSQSYPTFISVANVRETVS